MRVSPAAFTNWPCAFGVKAPARVSIGINTLLLSASNKTFLGKLLDLEVKDRREASQSAHALGILKGCRILRAHDVAGAKRVVDVLSAVLSASA